MNQFIDNEIRVLPSGYRMVHYFSSRTLIIEEMLNQDRIDGFFMGAAEKFTENAYDFSLKWRHLKAIGIQNSPNVDLGFLSNIPNLEFFGIDETNSSLDFRGLQNLRILSTPWHKKLFKNPELSNLERLSLWKFKSATNDLNDFPQCSQLQQLALTQGTITSLNGISRFSKLNDITLNNLTKLEYLGALDLPELKVFRADTCKKLTDHEELGACLSLEDLDLHRCGNMKSVEFIKNLKKLKSFRFMETEITDGDLSPLLSLEDVYFTEKKHYSHKTKNFNQTMDGVNGHKSL
jgi:hypothetical protein